MRICIVKLLSELVGFDVDTFTDDRQLCHVTFLFTLVEFHFVFLGSFLFRIYVQMVKCGDYFQAEDGPRQFGNICIGTKWIQATNTSLLLRNLEVNYKEV